MCATVLLFLLVEGVCSRKSTEPLQFIKSLGRFILLGRFKHLEIPEGVYCSGKRILVASFRRKFHFLLAKRQIYLLIDPLEKPPAGSFIALHLQWSAIIVDGLALFAIFETQHNGGPSQGNNLISSYQVGLKLSTAYNFWSYLKFSHVHL